MDFSSLQQSYKQGSISKADFIEQALMSPGSWHYSHYLKSCDIYSIYIDSENVCR